ncbi:MAG: carbohydrate porin [Acidobacteria bacterium]|nr:carbohydrate porin [Acidobacteriota bacterium]
MIRRRPAGCVSVASVALVTLLWARSATAQTAELASPSMFDRPADAWWWVSGQANFIFQWHPAFQSPYQGENSLRGESESALSRVLTLYLGARIGRDTEILFDVEAIGGRGLSEALGVGGFTNLDVVRNPNLGSKPYIARVMLHHTVALTSTRVPAERGLLSLAAVVPERRVEYRVGKLSTVDSFDLNGGASDSHLQFMNWTADNNGAYDYAADTRGYTFGAEIEYHEPRWALRFAEMLMPTVANGIDLDWHVARSHAENFEVERQVQLVSGRDGRVRLLAYLNHATMGDYRDAINSAPAGGVPDIIASRREGRVKYGFGVNGEQAVSDDARVFARLGWNEGRHESFAYTEVDRATALGFDLSGHRWTRDGDRVGLMLMINGLSADHSEYLSRGGLGFLLGDGALRYGAERIVESYYTAHVTRGVSAAFDVQAIVNPGYNRDRGPVLVPGLRLHVDF